MAKLPDPSQAARIVMNIGTLSGVDVLDFGKIEPGALVELGNGSTATVVKVEGRRLTRHGVIPGSVQIQRDGNEMITVPSGDITAVLPRPGASAVLPPPSVV